MNRRGQAMLEALFTSVVWSLGFLFLLKAALTMGVQLALDDWTDEFLLCRNETCEQRLFAQLTNFGISEFQTTRPEAGTLIFSAKSNLTQIRIKKEISLATVQQ